LDEANSELDEMKRFEKLAQAEFMMMQEQPVIPLQTQATNWIKKPYVKGMYPNPGTLHPWKFVYIERDPAKWDKNVDETIMTARDEWVFQNLERINATQKAFTEQKKAAEANTAE
jgi:oligopeptide transport system substrate-binding protein